MPRLTIGLTGGVASGKSAVEKCFVDLGVPVLDADQVARAVVAPPSPALAQIEERFGTQALLGDGSLNRRWLREQVFANAQARKDLEAITHPLIRQSLINWRDAQTAPYCVLAVAILIEGNFQSLVDRVLVVDAPVSLQRQRLIQRDGISETLAEQMIAAQASREHRLAAAQDVIGNIHGPAEIAQHVSALHDFYLHLAERGDRHAPSLRLPHQGE